MISVADAKDEVYGAINLVYTAMAITLSAPTPVVVWPGEAVPSPDAGIVYAQPFFEVITREQKSLRRINNKSLFESTCLCTLRIFAPQSVADGDTKALLLGQAVCGKLSKASDSGELWYRDGRATPVAAPVNLNQVNVVVTVVFQSEE